MAKVITLIYFLKILPLHKFMSLRKNVEQYQIDLQIQCSIFPKSFFYNVDQYN